MEKPDEYAFGKYSSITTSFLIMPDFIMTSSNCRGHLLTAVKFKTANYIRDNKIGKGFFTELSTVEIGTSDEEADMEVRETKRKTRAQ